MVDKLATAKNQFKENKVWQVILDKVHIKKQVNRVNIWGYSLNTKDLHRYRRGRTFKVNELKRYNEVVIDDLVGRIRLCANTLNLRLPPSATPTRPHAIRMLCTSADKGILKTRGGSGCGSAGGGEGGGYSRASTLSNGTLTTPTKSVSFNNTIYISPIATRHYEPTSSTTVKNYESMYKEYLQKVQMNGACSATNQTAATTTTTTTTAGSTIITTTTTSIPASTTTTTTNNNNNTTTTTTISTGTTTTTAVNNTNTTTNNTATTASSPSVRTDTTTTTTTMAVDISDESPPKRKRGRPKGSGIRRREEPVLRTPPTVAATVAAAATEPSPVSPVRKRGWPLGVPRKGYSAAKGFAAAKNYTPAKSYSGVKGKRGRPRKLPEFNFHSIVSDIKTIELPSELWSAHVSVTAKRSQVCFTRVVQALSSTVPVECDRSVKFNGSLKHLVRINNRDVELLGAPPAVHSIQDIQTLLQIVDDISINDPVLDYMHR